MKFIKIAPPGTWCFWEAFLEMIRRTKGKKFLEVGCGAGDISLKLLKRGYNGVGIDFSPIAIKEASEKLGAYIKEGRYKLIQSDLFKRPEIGNDFDIVIALLIMEHVEDDIKFLETLKSYVRPGGHVIISVPGRRDRWSLEDETVGHLRRYDRPELFELANKAGFIDPEVWSIAVPAANILFGLSKLAIKSSKELDKLTSSKEDQTKSSGVRQIPFKTVFPVFFRIFLNRITLYPLFILQRFFYNSGLGLTMLADLKRS